MMMPVRPIPDMPARSRQQLRKQKHNRCAPLMWKYITGQSFHLYMCLHTGHGYRPGIGDTIRVGGGPGARNTGIGITDTIITGIIGITGTTGGGVITGTAIGITGIMEWEAGGAGQLFIITNITRACTAKLIRDRRKGWKDRPALLRSILQHPDWPVRYRKRKCRASNLILLNL